MNRKFRERELQVCASLVSGMSLREAALRYNKPHIALRHIARMLHSKTGESLGQLRQRVTGCTTEAELIGFVRLACGEQQEDYAALFESVKP